MAQFFAVDFFKSQFWAEGFWAGVAEEQTETFGTLLDLGGKYHPYIHGPKKRKDVAPQVVEVIATVAQDIAGEFSEQKKAAFTKKVAVRAKALLREQLLNEGYEWAAIYGKMIADEYRKLVAARNAEIARVETERRMLDQQMKEEEQIVMMLFEM